MPQNRLCGILNINKSKGITSYDVIRILKRVLCESGLEKTKIGHCGTLDPMATGVLLILFNEATRIGFLLSSEPKEYIAQIRLGITTDTDDITGKLINETQVPEVSEENLLALLKSFQGEILQTPPVFSALRSQGERAYIKARSGEKVILNPRKVFIYNLELVSWLKPILEIKVLVSKGFYVRSLARDIGERLGCGATLASLIRTRIGKFCLEDGINLNNLTLEKIQNNLIPILSAIPYSPIIIRDFGIKTLLQGGKIRYGAEINLTETKHTVNREPCSVNRGPNGQRRTENGNRTLLITDKENKVLIIGERRKGFIKTKRLVYADLS